MREMMEYYFVKFLIFLASIMPKSLVYKIFKFISILLFKIDKKRRKLTIKNLTLSFVEKNELEIENLAKQSYIELSKTVAEIILIINRQLDINSLVTNAEEAVEKLSRYKNDGAKVYITAHFSNWELLAQFMAINGFTLTGIGRRGNNELIEDNITTPFRQMNGNKNIYKKNAIMQMIKVIKQNDSLGLLVDQKAGHQNSVRTTFFGRDVMTTTSVAMLKLKYNPILLPIFITRDESGRYSVVINDPIEYEPVGNKNEDIKNITQLCNDAVEEIVKSYPSQWFWMHNRWKL